MHTNFRACPDPHPMRSCATPNTKHRIVEAYHAFRRATPPEPNPIAATCAEFSISRSVLFKYRRQYLQNARDKIADPAHPDSAYHRGAE